MSIPLSSLDPYILGVDIGSSSCKALAWSPEGHGLRSEGQEYPTRHPRPWESHQDPDQVLEAVRSVIAEMIRQMGSQPLCLCFSSAMHSLMAVDGRGRPMTPLLIWSDRSSQQTALKLRAERLSKAVYKHTGTPVHAMSPWCKLVWWQEQDPGLAARAFRFISIKEYILQHLCGEYIVDHSLASATGMMDIRNKTWYAPALERAQISEAKLSALVSSLEILPLKARSRLGAWGLKAGTLLVPGASDGCLANLGSGAFLKGDLGLTIGTSGAVRMVTSEPYLDPLQRLFCFVLGDTDYVVGGAINNGGTLLDWFGHNMEAGRVPGESESYGSFIQDAMSIPAGSNGLLFLPYIYGERSPYWDERALGSFIGIGPGHGIRHFKRAVLEGMGFALDGIVQILGRELGPVKRIVLSGGFTKAPEWVVLLTDLLGRKTEISLQEDASAAGAAMMGGVALGIWKNWKEAKPKEGLTRIVQPGRSSRQAYRSLKPLFQELYPRLEQIIHRLSEYQQENH